MTINNLGKLEHVLANPRLLLGHRTSGAKDQGHVRIGKWEKEVKNDCPSIFLRLVLLHFCLKPTLGS